MIKFAVYMRKILIPTILLLAMVQSCHNVQAPPRPTIQLVMDLSSDTTGLREIVSGAASVSKDGSIAILGDPQDVIALARRFQGIDRMDNVNGRVRNDSIPDFAGETFDAILDAANAPYTHFVRENTLDSLREAAVGGALFAWDSTCYRLSTDHEAFLPKQRAKILVFASSLNAGYGVFDVDTLLQLTGGKSTLISPVKVLLEDALAGGAKSIAVWTNQDVKSSRTWEKEFGRINEGDATLAVISPAPALDVRTMFRDFMRQYQSEGRQLDAIIIDDYDTDIAPLLSELALIRREGTDEDAAMNRILRKNFRFIPTAEATISYTYRLMREKNLFSHRISRPRVKYYESGESGDGSIVFVEAASSYVLDAYVSKIR